MTSYRNVWVSHYGKDIPDGFHIHHIDGDHNNNSIENLLACSPEDHANLHEEMGQHACSNWIRNGYRDNVGENNPFYGKSHTEEFKNSKKGDNNPMMDKSVKERKQANTPVITCIHCGLQRKKQIHTRYHGDNCEYKRSR